MSGHAAKHTSIIIMQHSKAHICGEIKQYESELKHIVFLVFYLMLFFIQKALFFLKTPLKLDMSLQGYDLLKGCQNNRKQKAFIWLYLQINICEFRLIILDHITYI